MNTTVAFCCRLQLAPVNVTIVGGRSAQIQSQLWPQRELSCDWLIVENSFYPKSERAMRKLLVHPAGYQRPSAFRTDVDELRCGHAGPDGNRGCKWSPSTLDFEALGKNSGGSEREVKW